MLLELALRARIPLIAVQTTDPVNAERVLRALAGRDQPLPQFPPVSGKVGKGQTFYTVGDGALTKVKGGAAHLYSWMEVNQASLVIVNSTLAGAFDAGDLPTPAALVQHFLRSSGLDEEAAVEALPALTGLTLLEIGWVLRMAMAKGRDVSFSSLMGIRKTSFPPRRGLVLVDQELGPYSAPPALQKWLLRERQFFLASPDDRLTPRGLLFGGPPGTGKTMGAKWLARGLGVPLFRLEPSQIKGKYVGESEKALTSALSLADREAPCVLLIDEAEKLFAEAHDSGVTANILAGMLWWLQEHRSRVLTVMTTNDRKRLPPELVRPGRIDAQFEFPELDYDGAVGMARGLLPSHGLDPSTQVESGLQFLLGSADTITHARVAQFVIELAKDAHVAKRHEALSRRVRIHRKREQA